jgi:hypothetical protein
MPDDTTPTHVKINYGRAGRTTTALPNQWNPGNPFAESSRFAHLDGKRTWSEVWASLPDPFDGDHRLPDIDFDHWPEEYIQAAGRRGRLTVEIRKSTAAGFRQFVVGRPDGDRLARNTSVPTDVVEWSDYSVTVFPHEVWTSASATPVFRHWFETGSLPTDLLLRELDI